MTGVASSASEPAINLEGVGKRYWQINDRGMLLRSILPFAKVDRKEKWAVRDLDIRIEQGETVGMLGRNGAGKTTLLRLLAGVSQPTTGVVTIRGRVAPLISVGVGFHPEMSGRENVYVNAMLLGLTRAEIDSRFDDIVAFAELADDIDAPVKFYSSGMFMRLGFSVAVHVEPQVLLVDEILAVGDIAFQLKCLDRMREIKRNGTTILLVSHSMHAIRLLCPRALLMRRGELVFDGESEAAIAKHHELLSLDVASEPGAEDGDIVAGTVTMVRQELVAADTGQPVHHGEQTQPLRLRERIRFDRDVDSPQLFFWVLAEDGSLAYEMKTALTRQYRVVRAGEEVDVEIDFTPSLGGGTFRVITAVTDIRGTEVYHRDHDGRLLYMAPRLGTAGIADLDATITFDGEVLTDHDPLLIGDAVAALEEGL
jgi:ABC-2 type transport system ATP-binding protein